VTHSTPPGILLHLIWVKHGRYTYHVVVGGAVEKTQVMPAILPIFRSSATKKPPARGSGGRLRGFPPGIRTAIRSASFIKNLPSPRLHRHLSTKKFAPGEETVLGCFLTSFAREGGGGKPNPWKGDHRPGSFFRGGRIRLALRRRYRNRQLFEGPEKRPF